MNIFFLPCFLAFLLAYFLALLCLRPKPYRYFPQSLIWEKKTKRNFRQLGWLALVPTAVLIMHSVSLAYLGCGGLTYSILHDLFPPLYLLFTILLIDPGCMALRILLAGNFPSVVQAMDSVYICEQAGRVIVKRVWEKNYWDLAQWPASIHEICSNHNSTCINNS